METAAVGVRLKGDVWIRYSAEAQAQGMPLGSYLRRRLAEQDSLADELAALRRTLERALSALADGGTRAPPAGAFIEVLLLLRSLAGPQKAAVAQKELERRGLEIWR